MRLQRLEPDRAPAIAAVFRAAVVATEGTAYTADQVATWLAGMTEARLRAAIASSQLLGALDDDGALLGFANLVDVGAGAGELDLLYVDPAAGGRGVARVLVAEIERLAAEAGMVLLRVDASVLAAPVLEHLGYEVERTYDKEVGGVTFPNTWLRKSLRPAPTT